MSKFPEYSEIPFDDDEFLVKYSSKSSRPLNRVFSSNNLVILLLFAFISIISLIFILSLNYFNRMYNKSNFIPTLETSSSTNTSLKKEAYFDSNSQIYHLAQDQYKESINHNFQKLDGTSYYCFKEGTNWNDSIVEGKCICKSDYSLLDCGLNEQIIKSQLLRKQSNCHFKEDIVNIKRLNKPSKIILAMPLYECAKRECNKLIDELVKQYDYIVDLFIFVEIRNSKQEQQDKNLIYNHLMNSTTTNLNVDERVHLYSNANFNDSKRDSNENGDKQDTIKDLSTDQKQLNKVLKVNTFNDQQKNQLDDQRLLEDKKNKSNVIYQIKTLDLESIKNSKEIVSKVYGSLWNLVFKNVTNYRPTDKLIFAPPFTKVNEKFLNFFKFYFGFGEPVVLVDNFYLRTPYYRTNLPKDIQDDLDQMNSAVMMSFQYAQSVCELKFDDFSQDYCLKNRNLFSRFEKNYWKICKVTANALDS